jgi:hypothetical protein
MGGKKQKVHKHKKKIARNEREKTEFPEGIPHPPSAQAACHALKISGYFNF